MLVACGDRASLHFFLKLNILDDGHNYLFLLYLRVLKISLLCFLGVSLHLSQCLTTEVYIFRPKSSKLARWFVLGLIIFIAALLLHQFSLLVFLAVDEAALIDVLLGLVETQLIIVFSLLELPRIGDVILLETDFAQAMSPVILE